LFRRALGSTYGHGTHPRSASKYLSRAYGGAKDYRSSKNNNYNSLSSSKERDKAVAPYGVYESHMMTVCAGKERAGSAVSPRDEASGRNDSSESVVLLDDQVQSYGKKGGIMKTTEVATRVDTVEGTRTRDAEEGLRPECKEAHMV
jgi:hypothetical protein